MENRTVVGLAVAAVAALIIGAACSSQLDGNDSGCQGAGQLHAALAAADKPSPRPAAPAPAKRAPAAPPKLTKAPAPRPTARVSKAPHTAGHGHHGGHGVDIDIDIDVDGC
ncbi:hypothetical protein [Streptomyces carpinensis]|uniref:Lipoprotein n=1 Tax=Streptomyces carpinensis TaxID=66369 RepID=A0ABV1VVS4_9ACTN|nr:hypothetical protein [Streptomyces carpinensis]